MTTEEAVVAAVAEERERCAKIADELAKKHEPKWQDLTANPGFGQNCFNHRHLHAESELAYKIAKRIREGNV